jgi:hypothetical protein
VTSIAERWMICAENTGTLFPFLSRIHAADLHYISEQMTNMEAASRKSAAQQLDFQPMLPARQVASGDAEKPKVFLPPVSPPSTVQVPPPWECKRIVCRSDLFRSCGWGMLKNGWTPSSASS